MLMASIVASMMMGGFLLTVTGDTDDDISVDESDADGGHDLYADDGMGEGSGTDGWGDLLSDLMEDDALVGGPEAINAGAESTAFVDAQDHAGDDAFDDAGFEQDFAAGPDAYDGPWTEDGTEIVIDDFIPGEDELILGYNADDAAPQIDLFGDAAGNALVFADGHLTFKVLDGDGLVIPEDVTLVAETDATPTGETVPA